jgi:glycosyltransferase 2 family protein
LSAEPRSPLRAALGRLGWLVLAGAVAVSIGFLLADLVGRVPDVDWRFEPLWLAASAVALFLFAASHPELWRLMLRLLHMPLPAWRARAIYNASLLARYVPTGLMSIVVRVSLSEREGVPKRICAATLVYELGLSIAAALIISAWFFLDLPQLEDEPLRYLAVVIPVAALIALHPKLFHPGANRLLRRLKRPPLEVSLTYPQVLAFTAFYVAGFAVAGLGVYAFAHALAPVDAEDLPVIVASYSIGFTAGMFGAFLPGGVGAREAGLALALTPTLTAPVAIAVAVGVRILQTCLELGYAALTGALVRFGDGSAEGRTASR